MRPSSKTKASITTQRLPPPAMRVGHREAHSFRQPVSPLGSVEVGEKTDVNTSRRRPPCCRNNEDAATGMTRRIG